MQVFVVTEEADYEESLVMGVFNTEEQANEVRAELDATKLVSFVRYEVEEFEMNKVRVK